MTGSTTYLSSQVLSSAYKRFFQYVRTDLWLLVVAGAIVFGDYHHKYRYDLVTWGAFRHVAKRAI